MPDREIATAITAGNPAALAAAYSRHAAALHAYCRSLLAEPADATDAVEDAFIVAAAKLAELSDPSRLRPWLYAVTRNECRRRPLAQADRGSRGAAAATADSLTRAAFEAGPAAGASWTSADAEEAALRAVLATAAADLDPDEREIIELTTRHELTGADVADVLGVPVDRARDLQARARGQFDRRLGALLVARSGRGQCPDLAAVLADWDGRLSALPHGRLYRHIGRCAACGLRERRELRRAAQPAPLPAVPLPASHWERVVRLLEDTLPGGAAYRARVVQRAEPFRASGFPVPVRPAGGGRPAARYARAAAAIVVACAVLGAGILIAGHLVPPGPARARAAAAGISPAGAGPGGAPPSPAPASSAPARHRNRARTRPAPGTTPSAHVAASTAAPAKPGALSSARATPAAGMLAAAPATVTLASSGAGTLPAGSFTLTASGSPVAYTITIPAAYAGILAVTPSSGSLAAGQSVQISVTGNGSAVATALTISPGGVAVSVSYQAFM